MIIKFFHNKTKILKDNHNSYNNSILISEIPKSFKFQVNFFFLLLLYEGILLFSDIILTKTWLVTKLLFVWNNNFQYLQI